MRKKPFLLMVLAVFALTVLCGPTVSAQEEVYEKSGAGGLYDSLDKETKGLLEQAGVEDGQASGGLSGEGLFKILSGLLREKLTAPLKALAALVAVAVLCRLAGCFEDEGLAGTAQTLGAAACGVIMAGPVAGLLASCQRVAGVAGAFLTAAAPVYAGLLAASGNPATSGGYSVLAMGAGAAVPVLVSGLLLPLMRVYLALSVASAISDAGLEKLSAALYAFGKWALVLAATLFSGILSIQTAVNAQVDAAANKTAKLVLSSGVPIVGGALGDAVAAVQNSLHMVKSGAGAFGVLAALCIFLPAMVECALWAGVCLVGQTAGEALRAGKMGPLLGAFSGVAKMLLAMLVSVCVVCIVSAAAVLFVRAA